MSRVTELEKALTTLFCKGTEVGYTETEIDEFLENIDYHALLQAVWNKAETVYAYRADGKNALSLDYRSAELFKQRATLLYEDVGDSYIGAVFAARSMELWLLEDMLTSRRQAAATRRISTSPMMPSASAAQKQSFGQIWRLSISCKGWSLRAYRPARSSRKSSPAMWAGAVWLMRSMKINQTGRTSLQSCTPHFPRRNTLPPVRPR